MKSITSSHHGLEIRGFELEKVGFKENKDGGKEVCPNTANLVSLCSM